MSAQYLLIEPIDVLHLRGNRSMAMSSHGEAVMPPWPSVFAGALRTRIMVDHGIAFADFLEGRLRDRNVERVLGSSPAAPGSFRLSLLGLAAYGGREPPQAYFPLPADLVALPAGDGARGAEGYCLLALQPRPFAELGVQGSFALPYAPLLRTERLGKPLGGLWISGRGLGQHLRGEPVAPTELRRDEELWRLDPRLGIALDGTARTAARGMLYTADTVALGSASAPQQRVAFLVGVRGAQGVLPTDGLLRLGGDGRAAAIRPWPAEAGVPVPEVTPTAGRFRLVLATPGWFGGTWYPPGIEQRDGRWILHVPELHFEARLLAAAVPRAIVVSGWDLAARGGRGGPKPAERVVPAGAVYWFEQTAGGPDALQQLLRLLGEQGLWPLFGEQLPEGARSRQAEGFNNVWIGEWAEQPA